jgi:hypothetical protein
MTHKFGLTPFPLTITRTSRLPRKRLIVEVPAPSAATTPAGPADSALERNTDAPEAEGGNE